MDSDIDPDVLKKRLHYDPISGNFWKIKYCNTKCSIAGSIGNHGYVVINLCGRLRMAHRIAWFFTYGVFPVGFLDHINGIRTDNRMCNLREASRSNNNWNAKLRKDNTSGVKGVSWHASINRWVSYVDVGGKRHATVFKRFEDAEAHVLKIRKELHGKFVNHG